MRTAAYSLGFMVLANFLLLLDILAWQTGNLAGSLSYIITNSGEYVLSYLKYRVSGPWPICAIAGVGCWLYGWWLLWRPSRIISQTRKDKDDERPELR